ncbi:MAG: hypothetical protein ACOCTM_02880 [Bacteroidota bacterium]
MKGYFFILVLLLLLVGASAFGYKEMSFGDEETFYLLGIASFILLPIPAALIRKSWTGWFGAFWASAMVLAFLCMLDYSIHLSWAISAIVAVFLPFHTDRLIKILGPEKST